MGKVKKYPYAGHTGQVKDFIKIVSELTGSRNHSEVFSDFLELAFCAVAKQTAFTAERADALESRYMDVVKRHKPEYIRRMPELLAIAHLALDTGSCDFFGTIAGELGSLSSHMGQFFTPYEVCKLMAGITLTGVEETIEKNGFVTIDEPASGAGAMVLACADVLQEEGYDIGKTMYVQATDISPIAYKMTYLQLAMRGIPAEVFHGDSIRLEVWDKSVTPAALSFNLMHHEAMLKWRTAQPKPQKMPPIEAPKALAAPKPKGMARPPRKAPVVPAGQLGFDL